MRGTVAVCLVVGLLGWAPSASAEPPPVSLALEQCPHLSTAEVERIFSAELGSPATIPGDPNVTEVTIVCEGERVLVRVKDPLSRKTVQRSFDTKTFDKKATPRLVALAASELVLASWAELYSNPTPTVQPVGPAPSPTEASAVRKTLRERSFFAGEPEGPSARPDPEEAETRVLRLVALASVCTFPGEPTTPSGETTTLAGGGVRLGEERFRLVAWSLDTLIERGTVISHAGERVIPTKVTSFTIGGSLLAYYTFRDTFTVRLGVGLRAGIIAGDSPTVAPWGWPLGITTWTLRGERILLEVSGEGGYVSFPASGGEVRGFWLSGQIGVGTVL
ncbi:MAG TPA: hypothetical protein VMS65_00935 [Polyangiaceae bacterium]|nr:hypothetical protein [Polyangiaceae bacterium]